MLLRVSSLCEAHHAAVHHGWGRLEDLQAALRTLMAAPAPGAQNPMPPMLPIQGPMQHGRAGPGTGERGRGGPVGGPVGMGPGGRGRGGEGRGTMPMLSPTNASTPTALVGAAHPPIGSIHGHAPVAGAGSGQGAGTGMGAGMGTSAAMQALGRDVVEALRWAVGCGKGSNCPGTVGKHACYFTVWAVHHIYPDVTYMHCLPMI